jgi:hypothetical protein
MQSFVGWLVLFLIAATTAFAVPTLHRSPAPAASHISTDVSTDVSMNVLAEVAKALKQMKETSAKAAPPPLKADLLAKVQEFESKLTPSDIATITGDNPNSFYQELGRFELHSSPSCDFKAYTQMRKKVPFRALYQGGKDSSVYIMSVEGLYARSYARKIIQLLKNDSRFISYRPLANSFYALSAGDAPSTTQVKPGSPEEAKQKQIDEVTKEWEVNGISNDQVRKVAFEFGEESPECLGRLDTRFFDDYKMELTFIRGHYLLRKIRDYYLTNESMPDDIRAFAIEGTADTLFQSDEDGWYGTYVVEHVPGKVRLLAYGPDKGAKKPPILVGELPLK